MTPVGWLHTVCAFGGQGGATAPAGALGGAALLRHYYWMTFSYAGLLAAAVSEVATRVPGAVFWWAVALASGVVLAAGTVVIARRAATTLAPFRGRRIPRRGVAADTSPERLT